MSFKLWSEVNLKAKKELKPDLGFRGWNSLTEDEKYKIWKHLEFYFFDKDIKNELYGEYYYRFHGDSLEKQCKELRIFYSIENLNQKYKVKSYAKNFLENVMLNSACQDFYKIFIKEDENVVIELVSLYCTVLISERADKTICKKENEIEDEYKERLQSWRLENFIDFAQRLNEVFIDFGINIYLTPQGFIPRQEGKIIEQIYDPVLNCLANSKWYEVSKLLSDSFDEYRKNTPQGYSQCVTNTISAIEAFLQIIVNGQTGKGNFSHLITDAQKKNLVPNDSFTKKIFENMESIFIRERQETGIAHPKKEYATEKNSRTILNLAMVFFQHCIQK